jgi:pimeloyl-ACP methyl ester carboxylesterase
MPFIAVGVPSMHYEIHGDGEHPALIMGLALDVLEVERLVEGLAAQYLTVALDDRDAGRTDQPGGPYSVPVVNGTIGFRVDLGPRRAREIGISMGARVAAELVICHAERMAEPILVSVRCNSRGDIRCSKPVSIGRTFRRTLGMKSRCPQRPEAFDAERRASLSCGCEVALSALHVRTWILQGKVDCTASYGQVVEMARRTPHGAPGAFVVTIAPF